MVNQILKSSLKLLRHCSKKIQYEYDNHIPKIFGGEKNLMIRILNFGFIFNVIFINLGHYVNYLYPPSGFNQEIKEIIKNSSISVIYLNFAGGIIALIIINVGLRFSSKLRNNFGWIMFILTIIFFYYLTITERNTLKNF